MPAAAAAPPATTFCTCAPSVAESLTERALMPISACDTAPVRISSSAMLRASSMGMAKPRPIEPPSPWLWPRLRMAVLMPTTAPVASTSAPPELPGLIAASVWMASMTATVSPVPSRRTGRCSALTIPVVTVPARPSGEPMAITLSPTARADEAGGHPGAVVEHRGDDGARAVGGRRHDVVVGEHVARRVDDDAGAGAAL